MQDLEIFLKEVGKRIYDRRKMLRMTQEQLANAADLTPQFVSNAEAGKRAMRPENLMKIASVLDVSTDYILTGNIIEVDKMRLSEKMDKLTPNQVLLIENIIDDCIKLTTGTSKRQ